MLRIEDTVMALVDVQGRLAEIMDDRDRLFDSLCRLVRGVRALGIPVVWAEQTPEKMGRTIDCLRELLPGQVPIAKSSFSCAGSKAFMDALAATGRRQVLLAGIEAHICVFQTAAELAGLGYRVEVVADAVSSRTARNREIGLQKSVRAGASLTSVEAALFELMRTADHPAFRDVLKIVK